MGYAVAEAASRRGAKVILITGPTALETPEGVERVDVRTAEEMLRVVQARFSAASIAIFAAAVADYRPAEPATTKIKRTKEALTIRLEPNPDILETVAKEKGDRLVVGFAAETEHVAENARKKLTQKNADLIVANDVTAEGAGFDVDTNIVTIFSRDARDLPLPSMTKAEVAQRILDEVLRLRGALRSKPASHRAGD
jgi:phosphopantothenoylcysteine decarboxylase/phosphopantothenate--cysteine ligase